MIESNEALSYVSSLTLPLISFAVIEQVASHSSVAEGLPAAVVVALMGSLQTA